GGTKSRTVDVRILAATNDHLAERVRTGSFREDLFFRLSTVVLRLPPLRERGDDILLLAEALLERLAAEHHLPLPTLAPELRQRRLLNGERDGGEDEQADNLMEPTQLSI